MTIPEGDPKPRESSPIDYGSPDLYRDTGWAFIRVLTFIGGFLVGAAVVIALGFIGLAGNSQGMPLMSIVCFLGALAAGITFVTLLIRRPRGSMPFFLGLCLGACLMALLEGVCWAAIAKV